MEAGLDSLMACVADRWRPQIGDPHLMGWLTVAVYGIAALLAFWSGRRLRTSGRAVPWSERLFWPMLAVLMLALMVNKQLDLQSLLTAVGRCFAMADGWYADRRPVQRRFIEILALATCLGVLGLSVMLRRSLRRLWLVVLGVGAVCGFVLIRAVGFHYTDRLIGMVVAGWRMNWVLELGALSIVILGTLLAATAYGRRPQGKG